MSLSTRSQQNHLSLRCLCKWWLLWRINLVQEISKSRHWKSPTKAAQTGSPVLYKVGILIYHIPFEKDKKQVWREKATVNSREKKKDMPKKVNNKLTFWGSSDTFSLVQTVCTSKKKMSEIVKLNFFHNRCWWVVCASVLTHVLLIMC